MKCTLFLSTKYDGSALHHISRDTSMHIAPACWSWNNSKQRKINLYSYTCFVHSPSKFYRKTKQSISTPSRQNILIYQNDAFQFVSPKPKLAHCHRDWRKGCVLHFTTNKARKIKQNHWETILLLLLKEDISTGMGSRRSNAFGASPLEATYGGNSNMGPLLEPCAAEEQGKADRVGTSATSQILSALPTLQ